MKTADLKSGPQMDALVAMAQGFTQTSQYRWIDKDNNVITDGRPYIPSSGNAQTYELIERFKIDLDHDEGIWRATVWPQFGDKYAYVGKCSAPSEAICEAVIASKWGDVVPDDVWSQVA